MDDSQSLTVQYAADPNNFTFSVLTDNPDRDYFGLGLSLLAVFPGGINGLGKPRTSLGEYSCGNRGITLRVLAPFKLARPPPSPGPAPWRGEPPRAIAVRATRRARGRGSRIYLTERGHVESRPFGGSTDGAGRWRSPADEDRRGGLQGHFAPDGGARGPDCAHPGVGRAGTGSHQRDDRHQWRCGTGANRGRRSVASRARSCWTTALSSSSPIGPTRNFRTSAACSPSLGRRADGAGDTRAKFSADNESGRLSEHVQLSHPAGGLRRSTG